MIEIKSLTKSFPEKNIFSNCNYVFPDHGIFLITGENGSGKSTLFSLLSGFDKDYQGEILIDGKKVRSMDEKELLSLRKEKISLIVQHHSLIGFLRGETNKNIYSLLRGMRKKAKGKPLRKYSTGEKSELAIEREKESQKSIYLFDEVTNALDDRNFLLFRQWIEEKAKDCLILISTHDERFASLDLTRLRIEKGKLCDMKKPITAEEKPVTKALKPTFRRAYKIPFSSYSAFSRKHGVSFFLFTNIIAFLYILLIFPLFTANADLGRVFVSHVTFNTLLVTSGNEEGLEKSTSRYYHKKGHVLLTSDLPDDKTIHFPRSSESYFKNKHTYQSDNNTYVNSLLGASLSLSFSFDEDSTMPEIAYCTNPNTLKEINSDDLHDKLYLPFQLQSRSGYSLDFWYFSLPRLAIDSSLVPDDLEDDTFYCSEKALEGFGTSEENKTFSLEKDELLSPLFPNGIKLKALKDEDSVLPPDECFISDNTMTKVLQAHMLPDEDQRMVFYAKGDKKVADQIVRCSNFSYYSLEDRYSKAKEDSVDSVGSWKGFAQRDFLPFSSVFCPIAFLFLILFKTLILSSIMHDDEGNRKLWYSFGVARKRIALFYLLPLLLSEFFSLILGYAFSQLCWTVSFFPLEDLILPTPVSMAILLALALFSTLFSFLILSLPKKREKKETKKLHAENRNSFFVFFLKKNFRSNFLPYLTFSLLALIQYLFFFFDSYRKKLSMGDNGMTPLLYSVMFFSALLILLVLLSLRLSYERDVQTLVLLQIRGVSGKMTDAYFLSLFFLGFVSLLSGLIVAIGFSEVFSLIRIHQFLAPFSVQPILVHFLFFPYYFLFFGTLTYRLKISSRKELHRCYKGNQDD